MSDDLFFQGDLTSEDGRRLAEAMRTFADGQDALRDEVRTLTGAVDTVAKGFPGGDAEGHRRYHELLIEELEERRKLRRAIQEKTISGLVWAAIVGLGMAVWHELQTHINLR